MKKIVSLLITFVLAAAALAGCGASRNPGSSGTVDLAKEEKATEEAKEKEPETEAVVEEKASEEASEAATAVEEKAEAESGEASTEASTGAEEDQESSPFMLWEYEGYVDECKGYTWQKEFKDCDYDGDGKNDRVNRKYDNNEQTAVYTVEFGNGDKLICPEVWDTGFPHIQGGDLDGDGAREILVTFSYDTGTDPCSFGEMFLFDKDDSKGEYEEVKLPLADGEKGAKGFDIDFDKPDKGKIRFTIKEAGMSMEEEVDEDYVSYWWTDEATSEMRCVYKAEITGGDKPVLRCYVAPLPRNGLSLGFNLNYKDGKYEVGYVEKDSPDEEETDSSNIQSDNTEEETIPEYFVYVEAADGYANLRTGPGIEYDIICQIPNGESLEVYRGDATAKNGKKWLKVAYFNGSDDDSDPWITGWIAESQLQE
ncbi:MAG: SH3 domain-containing protein [Lachnospiraceae bacterium]|nr:SH3 domain-containing protein [Lachnospiraceae bacterium]